MMMTHEVIDNFLDESEFKPLQSLLMSKSFAWHYEKKVVAVNSSIDNHNIYMYHIMYEDLNQNSPHFNLLRPIFHKLRLKALCRVKCNFYPGTSTQVEHGMHKDFNFPHYGALLSINTNNGYTKLEDGTKVDSVANRMLLFDSSKPHTSATCTDQPTRINININYF
jgi:hypothetical protein|tara:strand:+ start:501 stop:998 length:498 start_codon:yes stop_codon:yes gene_type:complete